MPEYCNQAQLCASVGNVSPRTIKNWMAARGFPRPIRLSSKIFLWKTSAVRAWVAEREREQQLQPT